MQNSQEMAQQGSQQVEQLRLALNEIQTTIKQINDMNMEVASASDQQSVVANEIDRNIHSIKQLTERNTIGVEQGNTSGAELSSIAEQRRQQVDLYKVA